MAEVVNKLHTLTGHSDCVYTLVPDGAGGFFSAAGDGMVALWQLNAPETGKLVAKVSASVYALAYWPQQHALVVGQNYDGIHVVDLKSNTTSGSLKVTESAIYDLKIFGHTLLAGTGDGQLVVIDLQHMAVVRRIKISEKSIRCIVLNESIGDMALGLSDHTIVIVSMHDFSVKYRLNGHNSSVFGLAYTPDQQHLISVGRDAQLKIWDTFSHYAMRQSVVAHMYAIHSISLRPDGQYFATGSMDKTIKIWRLSDFKLLKVIDKARHGGHTTSVNKVLWTDYKNQLLSASDDRTISVWDLEFNS
jgi:WD40 repeat protein